MADPKLPLTGENLKLRMLLGGVPQGQAQTVKNFNVKERGTQHEDDYLGSDTDRLDEQTRGWDWKAEFDYCDASFKKAILDQKAARRARVASIPELAFILIFENRDGVDEAFILRKAITMIEVGFNGAKERGKLSLDGKAEIYAPVTL